MCKITLEHFDQKNAVNPVTEDNALSPLHLYLSTIIIDFKCNGVALPDELSFIFIELRDVVLNEKIKNCIRLPLNEENKTKPVIFIGFHDLLNNEWKSNDPNFNKIHQLDHSICQFYVQYRELKEFKKDLLRVINQITTYDTLELYDTLVCFEYQDIYKRTIRENILNGGHGKKIIPFLFTSKSIFLSRLDALLNNDKDILGSIDKLRILLVDDHAKAHLSRKLNDKEKKISRNKKEILEELLKYYLPSLANKIVISVEESINFLENNGIVFHQADIVLLDYNFNSDKSGIDFIKYLLDHPKQITLRGVGSKIHILPISSFNKTFRDDLRFNGLSLNHNRYAVHNGTDYINNPEVFIYNLLSLIINLSKDFVSWCIDWDIETVPRIQEVCYAAFNFSQKELENRRKEWINKFSEVSGIFSKITQIEIDAEDVVAEEDVELLKKDEKTQEDIIVTVKKGEKIPDSHSYLTESLQSYLRDPSNRKIIRILTHYRDLLYQLAFKSYQDNEYIFIEATKLKQALNS